MQKAQPYIIIALLILLIGLYFYFDWKTNKIQSEFLEYKTKEKVELIRVRDSASLRIDQVIEKSNKRIDSIANLPLKIKYIPYEKPYFINRNLDTSLDILSTYRYNAKPTETN